jgi:hypothetical protein
VAGASSIEIALDMTSCTGNFPDLRYAIICGKSTDPSQFREPRISISFWTISAVLNPTGCLADPMQTTRPKTLPFPFQTESTRPSGLAFFRFPFCSDFFLKRSKTEFQRGETIFSCQNV